MTSSPYGITNLILIMFIYDVVSLCLKFQVNLICGSMFLGVTCNALYCALAVGVTCNTVTCNGCCCVRCAATNPCVQCVTPMYRMSLKSYFNYYCWLFGLIIYIFLFIIGLREDYFELFKLNRDLF